MELKCAETTPGVAPRKALLSQGGLLWQTCQVVSGSPVMESGLQGHRSPWATLAQ